MHLLKRLLLAAILLGALEPSSTIARPPHGSLQPGHTVPDAPTIGTATATGNSISVTYTPPGNNGGSPITQYDLTFNHNGVISTPGLFALPPSPAVFPSLTAGTYSMALAAANAVGVGALSGYSNTVTVITVPDPPTVGTVTRGNASASIPFTAGATGGSAITGFTVTSSPGSITASGASSPITDSGLTNGTPYTFTVHATNAIGNSAESTASNTVTPATVPDVPTIGTATGGNGLASIAFTPNGTGGSPITGYTVTSTPGSFTASGASSPLIDTGLTNGTGYTFTVHATNALGSSAESGASNSVIPNTLTNFTVYANGARSSSFPATTDLSFSATITANSTAQVAPGSTSSMQVATNSAFGGGWQPGSLWNTIPPNGFDLAPGPGDAAYTAISFSVYTPTPASMYLGSHYSRATGNDINASTSVTQGSTAWGISANTWTTVTAPLSSVAMLGAHNFYKFVIGSSANTITYYLDNVTLIAGHLAWAFQGTGAPVAGWSDASSATADYTWQPCTLDSSCATASGLRAINNPANAASRFTATSSTTTMNVTAVTSGTINVGDSACWQSNLGGSSTPLISSLGSGSGGTGTYNLSSSQTVGSQPWASAPAQNLVTGIKLTSASLHGTLKMTTASFALANYTWFTFGVIPTQSGYGYSVQFLNTSGTLVGNVVNTSSSTTQHDFGVSTSSWTVENMALSSFGSLPANIGGFVITDTSTHATNVNYFDAAGFYQ